MSYTDLPAMLPPGTPSPRGLNSWLNKFLKQSAASVLSPDAIRTDEVTSISGRGGILISDKTLAMDAVAARKAGYMRAMPRPGIYQPIDTQSATAPSVGARVFGLAMMVQNHAFGEFYGSNWKGKGSPGGRPQQSPSASTAAISEGLREYVLGYTPRWTSAERITGRMGTPSPVLIQFETLGAEGWRGHVPIAQNDPHVATRYSLAGLETKCGFPSDGTDTYDISGVGWCRYPDEPGWFVAFGGNLAYVRASVNSRMMEALTPFFNAGLFRLI